MCVLIMKKRLLNVFRDVNQKCFKSTEIPSLQKKVTDFHLSNLKFNIFAAKGLVYFYLITTNIFLKFSSLSFQFYPPCSTTAKYQISNQVFSFFYLCPTLTCTNFCIFVWKILKKNTIYVTILTGSRL